MGRTSNRLSAVEVKGIGRKGMYHDGGGLYLQVSAGGAKSWIFRFMLDGRPREMGLGPVHAITLAEARKRAAECRMMRHDGIDPIETRRAERDQKRLEAAKSMTFDACATAYIDAHKAPGETPSTSINGLILSQPTWARSSAPCRCRLSMSGW